MSATQLFIVVTLVLISVAAAAVCECDYQCIQLLQKPQARCCDGRCRLPSDVSPSGTPWIACTTVNADCSAPVNGSCCGGYCTDAEMCTPVLEEACAAKQHPESCMSAEAAYYVGTFMPQCLNRFPPDYASGDFSSGLCNSSSSGSNIPAGLVVVVVILLILVTMLLLL